MWEFKIEVTCPHCEHETEEIIAFNEANADPDGIDSGLKQMNCKNPECERGFFYESRLRFEAEPADSYTKRPKR